MEICQLTNDYYKEHFNSNERLHLVLRKHINECNDCQEEVMELSKEMEIDKKIFGKEFEKVKLSWIGELTNVELVAATFFQRMKNFSERHKKYILSLVYLMLIKTILKEIFFLKKFPQHKVLGIQKANCESSLVTVAKQLGRNPFEARPFFYSRV